MEPVFRTDALVFHHIRYPDLAIEAGQVVFITGDSGTGKSTLLKLLNGVIPPTSGRVFYEGDDVVRLDPIRLRRRALLVGQSVYLPDGTIAENFAAFHELRNDPPPNVDAIRRYLELCRADFPLDTSCLTMSGGERQRVFMALCLSFCPRVLMLDEPTSALDTENATGLLENLVAFCRERKMTLVAVSHDRMLVERFAEAVITLERRDRP